MGEVRFVGVDVGKSRCGVAVVDDEGLVDEFSFSNDFSGIERLFRGFLRVTGCYGVHWQLAG